MALFGNNDKTISSVTLEECRAYCEEETTFTCISLDYTSSSTCYLSSHSHETDPDMFGSHAGSTYVYFPSCNSQESEEDEQGTQYYILYTYNHNKW